MANYRFSLPIVVVVPEGLHPGYGGSHEFTGTLHSCTAATDDWDTRKERSD